MPGCTIDKWGPATWNALHCFAHSAPSQIDEATRSRFLLMLQLVGEHLPCPTCRLHFLDYMNEHFPEAHTREDLVQFLNDAHNSVNARLGKPTFSVQDHYALYAPKRRHTPTMSVAELMLIVAIVTVILRSRSFKIKL